VRQRSQQVRALAFKRRRSLLSVSDHPPEVFLATRKETRRAPPVCPSCGRTFAPGSTWAGANYCRGLILLRFIDDRPGLSGWELSKASGVPYTDATRGLSKLREYDLVRTVEEEREAGGVRYRYFPVNDPARRERFRSVCSFYNRA
jgi:hypothetical protein